MPEGTAREVSIFSQSPWRSQLNAKLLDFLFQKMVHQSGDELLLKSKKNAKFFDFQDENRLIFVVLSDHFQNLF